MGSSTLRLKEIMNKPESLDMSRDWLALEEKRSPAIMLYSEKLAHAVLKSSTVSPYNLQAFWKKVSKAGPSDLPAMGEYFSTIPLLLNQAPHRLARKRLIAPYRRVERTIGQWLPQFTRQFLSGFSSDRALNPVTLSNSYINQVFKEIIARDISCPADAIPSLLTDAFLLLPRAEKLQKFEEELQHLFQSIEKCLATYGGNTEDTWALTSIAVMGREALLGAFTYGLINPPPHQPKWTGEALAHTSAPVNILTRQVEQDTSFDDLKLTKGQLVQMCPFIAHQHAQPVKKSESDHAHRSLSFGAGPHLCPGRSISIKIMDVFFNELHLNSRLHFDGAGIKLVRDFLLKPKE